MGLKHLSKLLMATGATFGLAACGGGGGGGLSFVPSPPASPTPSPTPTPTPTPALVPAKVFPDVTTTTEFAAIGLDASRYTPPQLTEAEVSVKYDSASGLYVMKVPGPDAGGFYSYSTNPPDTRYLNGELIAGDGSSLAFVNILKPATSSLKLTYTTLGSYDTGGMGGGSFGYLAFGTPTPDGSMPTTGAATYSAIVAGGDVNGNGAVDGTARLAFDFGAGKLSGEMKANWYFYGGMGEGVSLGTYTFSDTVYASGSTAFSGRLANPSSTSLGSFAGQFTGPSAQELMATWSAPFTDPLSKQETQMFGVWVGKHD